MDPLSHAACGRTLAAFESPGRPARAVTAAAVLGALSPDIDAAAMPFGWDIYLRLHEIGTHSAVGALACAALVAAAVRPFARHANRITLLEVAAAGSLSHVALDLVSGARIRIGWPLVDRQVSAPLAAMGDPWFLALWIAGVLALWATRQRPRRTAGLVLASIVAFLTLKAALGVRAVAAYRAAAPDADAAYSAVVQAEWAVRPSWKISDRSAGRVRLWRATAGSDPADLLVSWPVGDSSLVLGSRALPVVRNFLRAHHLGFAVTITRPASRTWVLWSDIRFCWDASAPGAAVIEPTIQDGSTRLACALWFGAEFDRDGRALRQIVRVGRFTQSRAVEP